MWRKGFSYGALDGWASEIFLALGELLKETESPTILSAGCGRGLVDYWLMQVFGWKITLLDNSPQCIKNLKRSLGKVERSRYELVTGSILAMPFAERSFDLVWNEGVVEHFSEADYRRALAEMVRVSRRFVLVDVPNAGCRPYLLVKQWLEEQGRWSWGYEQPRLSLRGDLEELGLDVLVEKSVGGRRTITNYLEMVPAEHRDGILRQLVPADFETFPHLLAIGVKRA